MMWAVGSNTAFDIMICMEHILAYGRRDCWPAAWLQRDLPNARLLTVEYAAPASNWEVGCLKMSPELSFSSLVRRWCNCHAFMRLTMQCQSSTSCLCSL